MATVYFYEIMQTETISERYANTISSGLNHILIKTVAVYYSTSKYGTKMEIRFVEI